MCDSFLGPSSTSLVLHHLAGLLLLGAGWHRCLFAPRSVPPHINTLPCTGFFTLRFFCGLFCGLLCGLIHPLLLWLGLSSKGSGSSATHAHAYSQPSHASGSLFSPPLPPFAHPPGVIICTGPGSTLPHVPRLLFRLYGRLDSAGPLTTTTTTTVTTPRGGALGWVFMRHSFYQYHGYGVFSCVLVCLLGLQHFHILCVWANHHTRIDSCLPSCFEDGRRGC